MSFVCDYNACNETFNTKIDLIAHKCRESDHFYCEEHDASHSCYLELVGHKAAHPDHISCPACGVDFRSRGGLKRHVEQFHRAPQRIVCPGCTCIFTTAASFIAHLEKNACPGIRAGDYATEHRRRVIQGHVVSSALTGSVAGAADTLWPPASTADSSVPDMAVSAGMQEAMSNMSIKGCKYEDRNKAVLKDEEFPSLHSRQDIRTPSQSTLRGAALDLASLDWGNNSSAASGEAANVRESPPAAAAQDSSTSVLPKQDFKLAIQQLNLDYVNRAPNANIDAGPATGYRAPVKLINALWWDPNHPKFSAEAYLNNESKRYDCPYPQCGEAFLTPKQLSEHLLGAAHAQSKHECPSCRKQFKTSSALLAHCESASTKCKIRKSDKFHDVVEDLTGGFLELKQVYSARDRNGTDLDTLNKPEVEFVAAEPKKYW